MPDTNGWPSKTTGPSFVKKMLWQAGRDQTGGRDHEMSQYLVAA